MKSFKFSLTILLYGGLCITFSYAAGKCALIQRIVLCYNNDKMSLVVRKPVFGVSDQVTHKPGFIVTEDS